MADNQFKGLRNNARSPGSISNAQHHDPSGSEKSANGIPATIKTVVADSTVETSIEPFAILWVVNRNASAQFIYVGEGPSPVVSATTGMALPAGQGQLLHTGAPSDPALSMVLKSSHSDVHVTIMKV